MAVELSEEELTVLIHALEDHVRARQSEGKPAEQAEKLILQLKGHQGAAPAAPPIPPSKQ